MDDHFWPALYPAIAVGLLMGLAGGSIVSTILGSVGGLLGVPRRSTSRSPGSDYRRRSCRWSASSAERSPAPIF